jgi:hypothetical protein
MQFPALFTSIEPLTMRKVVIFGIEDLIGYRYTQNSA